MSHSIYGATMARVVNVENSHQNIVYRFDYPSFEKHHFIGPPHWPIFHVFANSGDQMNAFLKEQVEVFADVALIAKAFSLDGIKEFIQNAFRIIHNVAGGDYKIYDFA